MEGRKVITMRVAYKDRNKEGKSWMELWQNCMNEQLERGLTFLAQDVEKKWEGYDHGSDYTSVVILSWWIL